MCYGRNFNAFNRHHRCVRVTLWFFSRLSIWCICWKTKKMCETMSIVCQWFSSLTSASRHTNAHVDYRLMCHVRWLFVSRIISSLHKKTPSTYLCVCLCFAFCYCFFPLISHCSCKIKSTQAGAKKNYFK